MHLIIDADGPLYRAAAAAQHHDYHVHDDHGWLTTCRYKKDANAFIKGKDEMFIKPQLIIEEEYAAIHNIKSIMGTLLSDISPKSYTCYLGGTGNYRYLINPEYKAGRPERPHHYDAVKRYLIKEFNAEVVNGSEADDACAMAQYADPENTMSASIDKDLLMVPGWHYNWVKKEKHFITEEQGDDNFYIQLCTGDSTDNISGLRGVGPVKAAKIIKGCTTPREKYEAVREAYLAAERTDIADVARQIWMSKNELDDWRVPTETTDRRLQ